jgi:hypothetical protein
MGLRVPPLLCERPRGSKTVIVQLHWRDHDRLLIKPRHGSRAVGAMSLKRLANNHWEVNGSLIWDDTALQCGLSQLASADSLLVQPFLKPPVEALDLSPDAPLEMRMTTAHSLVGVEPRL